MSDFANDPMIRKIRALLKKAEGAAKLGTPEGDNEASACNEMAARLIAKYGINQAQLAERGEIRDAIINRLIRITDGYTNDRRILLNNIVKALNCQVVFISSRRPGTTRSYDLTAHVFAHESDMNRIEFLFELLQPQMLLGAAAAQTPPWEDTRSFRKSWMSGFTSAIHSRLRRTQEEAVAEASSGTDLVLFDRSRAVENEYRAFHDPKSIVRSNSRRKLVGSGRSQGYAAGSRANLGSAVGGSRQALVSS